jgi:cytosine/adenosine deaminase-related metal-dependent hydrolase
MLALQSLVTRKDAAGRVWGARQRITVDEALQVCTLNGAYASFEENVKGSLTAGRLADFVVLEPDPHDVDPDRIRTSGSCARCWVAGRPTKPDGAQSGASSQSTAIDPARLPSQERRRWRRNQRNNHRLAIIALSDARP